MRPSADGLQYGCGKARLGCSALSHVLPAKQHFLESRRADSNRWPAHYECALRGCWVLLGFADSVFLRDFLFPVLPTIAGYCVRVRVKSAWIARRWVLFKPHSRASVYGATACSERPRNPIGRTVAIAPRHRRFIQNAGCRLTWGPSLPRERPLPELLPGSPQSLSVLPGVVVAARPPTRQDRPRYPCSRTSASALLRKVPLNPYPFSDTQMGRDFRVQLFHRHSAVQAAGTFAPCPLCRASPWWGKGVHTARILVSLALRSCGYR